MLLKQDGWDDVKARYSQSQFNNLVKCLVDIGIPKALLQNLWTKQPLAVPVIDLIKMDTSKQCPDDYKPPKSKHFNDFDLYLKPKFKLIA